MQFQPEWPVCFRWLGTSCMSVDHVCSLTPQLSVHCSRVLLPLFLFPLTPIFVRWTFLWLILQYLQCGLCVLLSVPKNYFGLYKPLRNIKWLSAITKLTAHFMCGLMIYDLVLCRHRKSMVIHDTECPYQDQELINNKKTNKYGW